MENRPKTKYRKRRICALQKNKCNLCKNSLVENSFCLDHIKPLALNGSNNDSNLQVLCINCNSNKTSKDLKDIWAYRQKHGVSK
jgi:5-methylcytosine-specific restriction enzyme A